MLNLRRIKYICIYCGDELELKSGPYNFYYGCKNYRGNTGYICRARYNLQVFDKLKKELVEKEKNGELVDGTKGIVKYKNAKKISTIRYRISLKDPRIIKCYIGGFFTS